MKDSTVSKSYKITFALSITVAVSVSAVAGILIGYYAISTPNCEVAPKPLVDPPLWPFVAHTWDRYDNYHVARTAWNSLTVQGHDRLDTVVTALTDAEMDDDEWSVAKGDRPDETGETTLDAMVMDGESHDVGAVGCLRGVQNAIGAAHAVMTRSTHSLLVADRATEFALEMGVSGANLSSKGEIDSFNTWKSTNCQPNFRRNVSPDPSLSCGPYNPDVVSGSQSAKLLAPDNHDTIGIIVIDEQGKMAVGTSTNGLRHKIHGRVGDSPIPGAGSYVDKEVGACTATGNGDVMIRFLPCLHAVEEMRNGKTAEEAARIAMDKIDQYYNNYSGAMLVVYKDGTYGGGCSGYTEFTFVYQHQGMAEPKPVTWYCDQ